MEQIWILDGARTPMTEWVGGKTGAGKPGGALKSVSAIDLGAHVTKGVLGRTGIAADEVDHVIMGNALQTSGDAIYGARHVALKAGMPITVPALTINRLCGSGLQSIISGTQMMQLGEASLIIAGGMENMSQAPHVIRGARDGFRLGQGQLEDLLMVALHDPYCDTYMAGTADNLARQMEISREEQDDFALISMTRSIESTASGRFAEEIIPVEIPKRRGSIVVDKDDHMQAEPTLEKLASLPTAFGKNGFVTAGNASGIVDGAAAVLLATKSKAKQIGKSGLARVAGWSVVGVEPKVMGIGPVPAIRKLLEQQGLALSDIGLFEINEAFAAQYLAVEKDLGLDRSRVNVNGGAIGLGHPLGATGTRLLYTLSLEMKKRGVRYGIASACIGGGQGIAVLLEAIGDGKD